MTVNLAAGDSVLGFLHVLRTTIKVMSSFCGWPPANSGHRRSAARSLPLRSLAARWRGLDRDHPFQAKFVSVGIERFGDAVGVKDQAIVAFERDGKSPVILSNTLSAVNAEGHAGRLQDAPLRRRGAVKKRRIMPAAGEGHVVVLMIENHVGHADEHVLLDVGIKLAIDLPQHVCRRLARRASAAQDAAANGHDERGRHAFAGDIGDGHAEAVVVHLDVIEIIAADLARGNVDAGDLEAVDLRRLRKAEGCAGCRARSGGRDRAASSRSPPSR